MTSQMQCGMDMDFISQYFFYRHYSSLEVASEYFRCGADKISIGSDAVYAAEEYLRTGVCNFQIIFGYACMPKSVGCLPDSSQLFSQVKSGKSSLEQISRVYGNQVISLSSFESMHSHYGSIHLYTVEMICTVPRPLITFCGSN